MEVEKYPKCSCFCSVLKLVMVHSLTNPIWLVNFEVCVVDVLYLPKYKNYLNNEWAAFFT